MKYAGNHQLTTCSFIPPLPLAAVANDQDRKRSEQSHGPVQLPRKQSFGGHQALPSIRGAICSREHRHCRHQDLTNTTTFTLPHLSQHRYHNTFHQWLYMCRCLVNRQIWNQVCFELKKWHQCNSMQMGLMGRIEWTTEGYSWLHYVQVNWWKQMGLLSWLYNHLCISNVQFKVGISVINYI